MMHDLEGHSAMYDNIRRVMLSTTIALEINDEMARIVIGPFGRDDARSPETVVFTRPPIVAAMSILAQVWEEQGGPTISQEQRTPAWRDCPMCGSSGGRHDNYGNWLECPECSGAGVIHSAPQG